MRYAAKRYIKQNILICHLHNDRNSASFCEELLAELKTYIVAEGRGVAHTSYLSFLFHGQDFGVIFCSTQKCVNRNKLDFASTQRKSYKTAYVVNLSCAAKFAIRSNLSLIHITKLLHRTNNFVMWSKIAFHVKQFCST